jgi:hypothetical protein
VHVVHPDIAANKTKSFAVFVVIDADEIVVPVIGPFAARASTPPEIPETSLTMVASDIDETEVL